MSSARIRLSAEGNVTISNRVESIPLVRSDRRYAAQYAATATACAVFVFPSVYKHERRCRVYLFINQSIQCTQTVRNSLYLWEIFVTRGQKRLKKYLRVTLNANNCHNRHHHHDDSTQPAHRDGVSNTARSRFRKHVPLVSITLASLRAQSLPRHHAYHAWFRLQHVQAST